MKNREKAFPLLQAARGYSWVTFRGDLAAGLTTAVMLVPQGMAYALLAGLPPVVGLYAALVPPLAYALIGTSRQLSVGPVAMDSLLVAASVGAIARTGTDEYWVAAVALGGLVGVIQVSMGLLRMGFLVNFLSTPVVSGFTSAAAVMIGLSQITSLLGIPGASSADFAEFVKAIAWGARRIDGSTALIGLGATGILVLAKKFAPRAPGALAVVALGTAAVYFLGLERQVAILGGVPSGLPSVNVPVVSARLLMDLLPAAATVALVSFMESISVGGTFARKAKYELDADRELVALGAANLMGAAFRGYPVAGGLSRTAVNAQAGARTQVAGLVAAGFVGLSLVFLTPLFFFVPRAVLAAIIVVAVTNLIDWQEVVRLWKVKTQDLILLLVTFVATLSLGIVEGIGVGVVASLLWFVYRTMRPHVAFLGRVPGTQLFRNLARNSGLITYRGILVVRMDAQFYFGNIAFLRQALREAEATLGEGLEAVVFDASAVNQLDSSAETALCDMWEEYRSRGVQLVLAQVKGPVRDVLESSGLAAKMGSSARCASIPEALQMLGAEPVVRFEQRPVAEVSAPRSGRNASSASARL